MKMGPVEIVYLDPGDEHVGDIYLPGVWIDTLPEGAVVIVAGSVFAMPQIVPLRNIHLATTMFVGVAERRALALNKESGLVDRRGHRKARPRKAAEMA